MITTILSNFCIIVDRMDESNLYVKIQLRKYDIRSRLKGGGTMLLRRKIELLFSLCFGLPMGCQVSGIIF
jgi:hypothetical protein